MSPDEIAEGRRLVASLPIGEPAACDCGNANDDERCPDTCAQVRWYYERDCARVALRDWLMDRAAELLDAAEIVVTLQADLIASTDDRCELWARAQKAERDRDQAQAIVALLADAMHTWGQETEGVPKDGPVAEAYDTALSMLAVWRKS